MSIGSTGEHGEHSGLAVTGFVFSYMMCGSPGPVGSLGLQPGLLRIFMSFILRNEITFFFFSPLNKSDLLLQNLVTGFS